MKFKFKIPRQVFILGMISFFTDFASEMLYPVAPIFLTAALGASMATVGLIEGIAEIIANLLKGYFGALSDKVQKRALFVKLGYTLSALVKPLPGFFPNVTAVASARALDRIGKGIRTSPRDALLAAEADANNKGAIFGFHRSMDTFGAVAGPLVALLILFISGNNYRTVFYFSALPSLGAIYFAFKTKEKITNKRKREKYAFVEAWNAAPFELKRLLLLTGIFSLANSSDVFLILRLKEISHSDAYAIGGYVYFNAVYAFLSFPAGSLADKIGKRAVYSAGLLIFATVYFMFASSNNLALILAAFTLYGFYSAATEGVLKAWISDLTDDKFRATVIGAFNTINGFGIMLGSVLTGILWDAYGAQVPFYISSGIALIIAPAIFISVRKKNFTKE